ncbi:hypothetical protein HO173_009354 [Letharia columbiana]|uniref:Cytochrome P450 n=1 Tax=Letharia columbiana TaxID=112416 RepID=A0A8H6L1X2_9LECA|nr:uncharacterized protein HO173_009354 [Letharia columbiana]KAF6232474.1 hypothetical protein HO173_009354 [Letharia columbiana]
MLTPVYLSAIVLGASLLVYVAYRKTTTLIASRKFARLHGCKPAKADRHWDPIFGLDFVISTIRASRGKYQLEDLYERLTRIAPTFTSNVLGETLIFTDEPKNVQGVLATQFPDFDVGELRRQATVKLLGHGIFNADGPYWEHSRALIRPNFIRKQVADLRLMEHHVMHMISYLPADGTPVNIQDYFFRMTLDTATEFLFGKSIDSLRPDATAESKQFSWAFDYALGVIAQKLRLGPYNRFYQSFKYNEACKYIHDYVRPIIHNAVEYRQAKNLLGNEAVLGKGAGAEASMKARKILRDADAEKRALLDKYGDADEAAKENDNDERYVFLYELAKHSGNEKELRDQVINTLIAGRDTTASLMSSTLFVLSRRPDVWAKLHAEVATLNGKPPTFDQIKDLKYLRNLLHEALRLYPVVPINAKFANKDTWLPRGGGADGQSPIFVQKGQMVIWVLYSMHRRKDLWGQDAEEFRPERWEGLLPGFNFLPFNGGPRICPGQQFALTEASYTIVRLCQQFSKIEVVPGQEDRPWTESLNLTCAVAGGVNVRCWK